MKRIVLDSTASQEPALRLGWTVTNVSVLQVIALLLPLAASIVLRGPAMAGLLATAIIAAIGWEIVVALLRHRSITFHGLTTALIIAIMAPADAALWQVALAVSFGAVIGELAFGGRGFGIVNAALAALAFLLFSFPGLSLQGDHVYVALATLPGAALLLYHGLLPWRVLIATPVGLAIAGILAGNAWAPFAALTALAFPLVFLIADPLIGSFTNAGRFLYGLLAGALSILFQANGTSVPGPEALVFAALVAAIFAPLIDESHIRLRARFGGQDIA